MATYDLVQTVQLLNFAANGASNIAATERDLQGYLKAYLSGGKDPIGTDYPGFFTQMNAQLAGGDWTLVWGPEVYSVKPLSKAEAANAMYVAYSKNLATWVVAIAATNPASIYDWVAEDGDVAPEFMAPWPLSLPFNRIIHPKPAADKPYISAATALGVSNLLTKLFDASHGYLQNFLTNHASPNDTLIFTGHSLAGALAPTTALHLYPDSGKSGWKQVLTLPTAGASPGNASFASLFASAYPATPSGIDAPYGTWNIDYANANDVVPHAWNQLQNVVQERDAAGNYPSFFGVLGPIIGAGLSLAIHAAERLSGSTNYYQNLPQTVFTPEWGTWVNTWDSATQSWLYPPSWETLAPHTDANPLNKVSELGQMLLATHISQYSRFFNMFPPPKMPTKLPSDEPDDVHALHKQALLAAARIS
jgi:hypothetical protein